MSHGLSTRTTVWALLLALILPFALAEAGQSSTDDDKSLFGPTKVWSIHLEITAKEIEAMQPPQPGGFGPAPQVEGKRTSERSLFGTVFRWAQADFTANGLTLKKVGIRYAGDITYLVSAIGLKRPLKITFDKFQSQEFGGLSSVQLHAMPLDDLLAQLLPSHFDTTIEPNRRSRMNVNTDAILALPTAEKLELMELLWDNLGEAEVPVPEWADREATRRRDEMLANPSLGSGPDETWSKIAKRNG